MLSKQANEYSEWIDNVYSNIEGSSWATSEKCLELYLFSQLFVIRNT
jgi:hypothetical protein